MNRTIPQLYNGSARRHIPRGEFHGAAQRLVSINVLYSFSPDGALYERFIDVLFSSSRLSDHF